MPGSVTSVFGGPDDFHAALREDGVLSLLVTGNGPFRARLTQVALDHMHLSTGDEHLSRIAFVGVPADTLLVSLPIGDRPGPIWGGVETQASELMTFGPGQRIHTRTTGPCRWGAIRLSSEDLAEYGRALSGAEFALPPIARWRPRRAALRQLRHFHHAAIRTAEARLAALANSQTAHGLEQQVIHALIQCLSARPVDQETEAASRYRGLLARFEDLLLGEPFPSMDQVSVTLGISKRMLREYCRKQLGMGPDRYRRLRGMQLVRRALRSGAEETSSVCEVARRYGYRDPRRFLVNYRALYGELPSATLQRTPCRTATRSKWPQVESSCNR